MGWLEDPQNLAAILPAFAIPLAVFAAALIEYVFPPIWGDLVVLLGFFLAGHGAASFAEVFAAALLGSLLGSFFAYRLGRRYGLGLLRRFIPSLSDDTLTRLRQTMIRFQEPIMFGNRFLPVIRSGLLFAAGALRFHLGRTLFFTTLGALGYLTFMMWVGQAAAASWDDLVATFRQSSLGLTPWVVIVVLAWIGIKLLWARRKSAPPSAAPAVSD